MIYPIRSEAPAGADEVIYRCVNGACVRPFPRRVNYCPFCGTSQSTGLPRPGDAVRPPPVSIVKPAAPAFVPPPAAAPVPPVASVAKPPPAPSVRAAATPSAPPQREPVRLRYWLLALGALALIWFTQRPTPARIESRIGHAIALAEACKSGEAQSELIALKDSAATPEQLQRLQAALNEADVACDPKRARPRARKKAAASQQAQSARNLIADARQALAVGNYKAASDKMEVCGAMVDAANRECIALKARADRLQQAMQSCVAAGREWIDDRCL